MDEFNELAAWALARKWLTHWIAAAAIVLFLVSGLVWWRLVYENPYNVYWGMLSNSLATSSVTKQLTEQTNGTALNQYITLKLGVGSLVYGRTTLKDAISTVTTESVGTLTSDYVRYTGVNTSQKSATGGKLNFASVLNKWAKASVSNTSDQTGSAPFYVQAMLGVEGGNLVPMANLSAKDRDNLLLLLHQSVIFDTSFTNVQKKLDHGRPQYTYEVNVEPVAYMAFEKAFASSVGIKTLANVDPNAYQNQAPIKVEFVVDARSHRLAAIRYPGTNHAETYSAYGVPPNVSVPKATISNTELQSRLSQVQ